MCNLSQVCVVVGGGTPKLGSPSRCGSLPPAVKGLAQQRQRDECEQLLCCSEEEKEGNAPAGRERERHLSGEQVLEQGAISQDGRDNSSCTLGHVDFMGGFCQHILVLRMLEPVAFLLGPYMWAFLVVVMAVVNCYGAGGCATQHANTLQ